MNRRTGRAMCGKPVAGRSADQREKTDFSAASTTSISAE
jgi:hypothetical protein